MIIPYPLVLSNIHSGIIPSTLELLTDHSGIINCRMGSLPWTVKSFSKQLDHSLSIAHENNSLHSDIIHWAIGSFPAHWDNSLHSWIIHWPVVSFPAHWDNFLQSGFIHWTLFSNLISLLLSNEFNLWGWQLPHRSICRIESEYFASPSSALCTCSYPTALNHVPLGHSQLDWIMSYSCGSSRG